METFSALPVPAISPHKGQWRVAMMFSFICARINDWVNNREAGDLRRHRGHYDVIVMEPTIVFRTLLYAPRPLLPWSGMAHVESALNRSYAPTCVHDYVIIHGNPFRITGALWGESIGHRGLLWKGPLMRILDFCVLFARTNSQIASDLELSDAQLTSLRCHRHDDFHIQYTDKGQYINSLFCVKYLFDMPK